MENMRILRVTGKGQIKVKPDVTRITMTLNGIRKDYAKTLKFSTEDTEKLKGYILGLPHIHEDVINHQLAAVFSVAAGRDVEIKNIREHLSRVSADNRFSIVYTQENEKLSMSIIEQRYAAENEILQAVALGNLSRVRKIMGKMMDQDIVDRYSPSISAQKKAL